MVEEQAIRIEIDAAKFALKGILGAARAALHTLTHPGIKYGRQTIKELNRQGRELNSVETDSQKMREVKKELKAYGVDFAVEKDRTNDKMYIWFKGQDVERIQKALENLIAGEGKEKPGRNFIRDICDRARQQAATLNAGRKVQHKEHGERL